MPSMSSYPPTIIVSNITKKLVGDEVYTAIYGYSEYTYKTVYVNSKIDISTIDVGDVINCQFNAAGKVSLVRVLYDCSADKTSWSGSYSYSSFFRLGTVESVDYDPVSKKQAIITLSYDGNVSEYVANNVDEFKFVVYNQSLRGNKVFVGDLSDVISGIENNTEKQKLLIVGAARNYIQLYLFK